MAGEATASRRIIAVEIEAARQFGGRRPASGLITQAAAEGCPAEGYFPDRGTMDCHRAKD